ncbi:CPS_collapsed_G0017050.mRNA.1.CDS.1 [Saccharomyces cerevisiae]|nr:CPS_collapsed_G0017050.mRNA.1.CDS.1 [Saccharomyces cerevisiae]
MSDENPSKRTTFGRILFNNFEDVNKREARKIRGFTLIKKILKNSAVYTGRSGKNRKSVIISGTHSDNDQGYNINKNTGHHL